MLTLDRSQEEVIRALAKALKIEIQVIGERGRSGLDDCDGRRKEVWSSLSG